MQEVETLLTLQRYETAIENKLLSRAASLKLAGF